MRSMMLATLKKTCPYRYEESMLATWKGHGHADKGKNCLSSLKRGNAFLIIWQTLGMINFSEEFLLIGGTGEKVYYH